MIRINLLGETVDNSTAITAHVGAVVVSLGLTLATCVVAYNSIASKVETAQRDQESLERQLTLLKKKTEKVEELEKAREHLKQKLTTIAGLKAKKRGPVKILDTINLELPERSWLDSIRELDGFIELNGLALDNQTIAQFMGALQASKYFGEVSLVHSRHVVTQDVPLKEFRLRAQVTTQLLKAKVDEGAEEAGVVEAAAKAGAEARVAEKKEA